MRVAHAVAIWATAFHGTGQTPRAVISLCERTLEQLQLRPHDSGFWTLYERLLTMRAGRAPRARSAVDQAFLAQALHQPAAVTCLAANNGQPPALSLALPW
jgi:hypothetical protein